MAEKIYPYWRVSLTVALTLFPLILIANIAQVYTSGSSAPVARAEMLQSLVYALLRFGFVAGSWWLTNTVIKITWGLAEQIALVDVGPSGGEIAAFLTKLIITAGVGVINPRTAIFWFYVLLFFFFLAVMLVLALMLSHYAFIAIASIFVVIAPAVIAIGSLPFFNWLYGTWVKMTSGLLMLPIANVLILKLALTILPFSGAGSMVQMFVALGVLGVLITVNYAIAKTVFGPAMQSAKMAGKSMFALGKLAAQAVSVASGAGGMGTAIGSMLGNHGGGGGALDDGMVNGSGGLSNDGGGGWRSGPGNAGNNPGAGAASSTAQTPLAPGRLNALRRKADAGALTHQELAGAKADWQAQKSGFRLPFRDPALQSIGNSFMQTAAAPVDKGFAELEGQLRDQAVGDHDARPGGGGKGNAGAHIPWRAETFQSKWSMTRGGIQKRVMDNARINFTTPESPFYDDISAKVGDPQFEQKFNHLVMGTAVVMADGRGGNAGHAAPYEIQGMDLAAGLAAIEQAGGYFGGSVGIYANNILQAAERNRENNMGNGLNTHLPGDFIRGILGS
jgi:hypothetical protein